MGAGLERSAIEDLHTRVPLSAGQKLLRDATMASKDPLFALHAAARVERATFGLLEYLVASQGNRDAALATFARLAPLAIDELSVAVEVDEDETAWSLGLRGAAIADPLLIEYFFGLAVTAQRDMTDLPLLRVELAHAPRDKPARYREVFGAPVVFRVARAALVYPTRVDSCFPRADPALAEVLEPQARAQLAQLPSGVSYASRVEAMIRARFGSGTIELADAAAYLHMSERTLRRRLEAEGVSYGDVVDRLRRETAMALLERHDLSIERVAMEIGFASAGAFRRAFHRWTGQSPRDYRARLPRPRA